MRTGAFCASFGIRVDLSARSGELPYDINSVNNTNRRSARTANRAFLKHNDLAVLSTTGNHIISYHEEDSLLVCCIIYLRPAIFGVFGTIVPRVAVGQYQRCLRSTSVSLSRGCTLMANISGVFGRVQTPLSQSECVNSLPWEDSLSGGNHYWFHHHSYQVLIIIPRCEGSPVSTNCYFYDLPYKRIINSRELLRSVAANRPSFRRLLALAFHDRNARHHHERMNPRSKKLPAWGKQNADICVFIAGDPGLNSQLLGYHAVVDVMSTAVATCYLVQHLVLIPGTLF